MTRQLKQAAIAAVVCGGVLMMAAAYSHIVLPSSFDPCQQDETHIGHVSELAPFHCIGHSERDPVSGEWDHVHPWMEEVTTEFLHGGRIVYGYLSGGVKSTPRLASL